MKSYWGIEHGEVAKTFVPGQGYVKATDIVRVAGKSGLRKIVRTQRSEKITQKLAEQKYAREAKEAHSETVAHIKEMRAQGKVKPSSVKGVEFIEPNAGHSMQMKAQGLGAYAMRIGSRKHGQKVMIVPKNSPRNIVEHELAHLTPNRSGHRMYQLTENGKKTMREEARADMASGSYRSYHGTRGAKKNPNTGYVHAAADDKARAIYNHNEVAQQPFGALFRDESKEKFGAEQMQNYREVQDKIYNARVRSGKRVFRGNQYVDDLKRRRAIAAGVVGAPVAAGGGYGFHRYKKRGQR